MRKAPSTLAISLKGHWDVMQEKLYEINWAELSHAYGSAIDVPQQLLDLASAHGDVRANAISALYGNIFHQGERYEPAVYAIPFLFELLESETVQDKHEIIDLLLSLAMGYEDEYLPAGFDPQRAREQLQRHAKGAQAREETFFWHRYAAAMDCYEAVLDHLYVFQRFSRSQIAAERQSAIYALAWFPDRASGSIAHILTALRSETRGVERANALLSLGLLSQIPTDSAAELQSLFDAYRAPEYGRLVNIAAAMARSYQQMDEKDVDILVDYLARSEDDTELARGLRYNDGFLADYVQRVMVKAPSALYRKATALLMEHLKTTRGESSEQLIESLFYLVFKGRNPQSKSRPLRPEVITALRALVDHGDWDVYTASTRFPWIMDAYALPHKRASLVVLLKQTDR